MNVGPFPLEPVITRLQQHAPLVQFVGDSAGLASALAEHPPTDVAAYVAINERGRTLNYSGSAPSQKCDIELLVVIFMRVPTDSSAGPSVRSQMDIHVIPSIRLALLGWSPDMSQEPMTLLGARDEVHTAQWLVSHQTFASSYRISPPPA